MDHQGPEIIVAAMGRFEDDVDVQRTGCYALLNISVSEEASRREAIFAAGGIAAVSGAMIRFPDDPVMQAIACRVLGGISFNSIPHIQAIASAGCLELIIAAIDRYAEDVVAMRDMCSLLYYLGFDGTWRNVWTNGSDYT